MITLDMVLATLDVLQLERGLAYARSHAAVRLWKRGEAGLTEQNCCVLQERAREMAALTMAWQDVVNGCRTDADLRAKLAGRPRTVWERNIEGELVECEVFVRAERNERR